MAEHLRRSSRRPSPGQPSLALKSSPVQAEHGPRLTRVTRSQSIQSEQATSGGSNVSRSKPASRRVKDVSNAAEVTKAELSIVPEVRESSTPVHPSDNTLASGRASFGAHSDMSGTTVFSSRTNVDAAELDPRMMADTFVDVDHASDRLIQHLVNHEPEMTSYQVLQELRKPGANISQQFGRKASQLEGCLAYLSSDGRDFVKLNVAAAALQRDSLKMPDEIIQGLDELFYKVNLAILAKSLAPKDRDKDETYALMRKYDASFFLMLLPAVTSAQPGSQPCVGSSALRDETFNLALNMRTQLAYLILYHGQAEGSAFNPEKSIADVFKTASSGFHEHQRWRGWQVPGLGTEDTELEEDMQRRMEERYNDILRFVQGNQDLEGMGLQYDWHAFLVMVLDWIRLRHDELSKSLKNKGGIREITPKVIQALRLAEFEQGNAKASKNRKSSRRKSTQKGERLAIQLKQFEEKRLPMEDPAVSQDVGVIELAHDRSGDNWQPVDYAEDDVPVIDVSAAGPGEETPHSPLPGTAGAAHGLIMEDRELYKENMRQSHDAPGRLGPSSFFDRQPNATRVEFGETLSTQASDKRMSMPPSNQHSMKRKIGHVRDSQDDDDTYEEDARSIDRSRRQSRPSKRRNRGAGIPETQPDVSEYQSSVGHHGSQRRIMPEHHPNDESDSENEVDDRDYDFEVYRKADQIAKQRNVQLPQDRKARELWTGNEEKKLLKALKKNGCKWSLIQQTFFSSTRDQVQIKDKARNMKFNLLSGGGPCPTYLKAVTLGKVYEERLRRKGIAIF